ncbi:hypothetical protein Alsa2_CDS0174 [Staphylococcus phage Alsa_2]|nr:hypothetical protein Alsa2_CDS0174 [Staphylococcus phage Alsa_2]
MKKLKVLMLVVILVVAKKVYDYEKYKLDEVDTSEQ